MYILCLRYLQAMSIKIKYIRYLKDREVWSATIAHVEEKEKEDKPKNFQIFHFFIEYVNACVCVFNHRVHGNEKNPLKRRAKGIEKHY